MRAGAGRYAGDARRQPGLRRAGRSGLRRRAAARALQRPPRAPRRRDGGALPLAPAGDRIRSRAGRDLRAVRRHGEHRPAADPAALRHPHRRTSCCRVLLGPDCDLAPTTLVRETWRADRPAPTSRRGGAQRCTTAWCRTRAAPAASRRPTPRLPDAGQRPPAPGGLTVLSAARPDGLGRALRQQRLAAGMPEAADQAGLGQRRARRTGGRAARSA